MLIHTKKGDKKYFSLGMHTYIIKKYNSLFEELLKKYDISQIEVDVLAFLANNPEYQYAQDIVKVRGISKSHVSTAIDKLVKRGYVSRNPDPKNRRFNVLHVEKKAQNIVQDIQEIQHSYNQMSFQDISLDDIVTYHEVLQKIYHNLGGGHDE